MDTESAGYRITATETISTYSYATVADWAEYVDLERDLDLMGGRTGLNGGTMHYRIEPCPHECGTGTETFTGPTVSVTRYVCDDCGAFMFETVEHRTYIRRTFGKDRVSLSYFTDGASADLVAVI